MRIIEFVMCVMCVPNIAQAAIVLGIPDDQTPTPPSSSNRGLTVRPPPPSPPAPSPPASIPQITVSPPLRTPPVENHPPTDVAVSPPHIVREPSVPRITREPTPREERLPIKRLDPETATTAEFIDAAKQAIKTGQMRVATDWVDHAKTRILSRSVAYNATNEQITNDPLLAVLSTINQAIQAGDRQKGIELLDRAMQYRGVSCVSDCP